MNKKHETTLYRFRFGSLESLTFTHHDITILYTPLNLSNNLYMPLSLLKMGKDDSMNTPVTSRKRKTSVSPQSSSSKTPTKRGRGSRKSTSDGQDTDSGNPQETQWNNSLQELLDQPPTAKNSLPLDDRDLLMDKVFAHNQLSPFHEFVEASDVPWTKDEIIRENMNVVRNFAITSIQISLHGPMPGEIFYALPHTPADQMEKWDMPLAHQSIISGGKVPIKVEFTSILEHARRKKRSGYIFSVQRNEDGYLVCYMDKGQVNIQRIDAMNLNVLSASDLDPETIDLMQEELRQNGLLM